MQVSEKNDKFNFGTQGARLRNSHIAKLCSLQDGKIHI
jgi:hypothetical protein